MEYLALVSMFFGGVFFVNGIPHFVNGISGRTFPTPFATPPGVGQTSCTGNVLWGMFNFVVAYFLTFKVYSIDVNSYLQMISFALGALLIALFLAKHFGHVYANKS